MQIRIDIEKKQLKNICREIIMEKSHLNIKHTYTYEFNRYKHKINMMN